MSNCRVVSGDDTDIGRVDDDEGVEPCLAS